MTEPSRTEAEAPRRAEAARRRRSAHKQVAERQRRQSLLRRLGIAAAVVAVLVIAGVVLWPRREAPPPAVGAVQTYDNLSRQHTDDAVDYAQPPAGGPHDPVWQNCGFYDKPIRTENGVHTLEHGAVWITYRPDLPQDQIDLLRELAANQTYILVSPMDDLPAPVVASAWGNQLLLDAADDPGLDDFVRRYRLDPAGPEPGAPCTGGTSETA